MSWRNNENPISRSRSVPIWDNFNHHYNDPRRFEQLQQLDRMHPMDRRGYPPRYSRYDQRHHYPCDDYSNRSTFCNDDMSFGNNPDSMLRQPISRRGGHHKQQPPLFCGTRNVQKSNTKASASSSTSNLDKSSSPSSSSESKTTVVSSDTSEASSTKSSNANKSLQKDDCIGIEGSLHPKKQQNKRKAKNTPETSPKKNTPERSEKKLKINDTTESEVELSINPEKKSKQLVVPKENRNVSNEKDRDPDKEEKARAVDGEAGDEAIKMFLSPEFRRNPLVMIVNHATEDSLTLLQFQSFRRAVSEEIDATTYKWPRFEQSFYKLGLFVIIAANNYSRNWLYKHFDKIKERSGLPMKAAEVYHMVEATVRVTSDVNDPPMFLRRLQGFNPILSTSYWRVTSLEDSDKGGKLMTLKIPEWELEELKRCYFKPYYDIGRLDIDINEEDVNTKDESEMYNDSAWVDLDQDDDEGEKGEKVSEPVNQDQNVPSSELTSPVQEEPSEELAPLQTQESLKKEKDDVKEEISFTERE